MIRGVTVDWWHTLAEPHEGWEPFAKQVRIEGIQRVLQRHGITCTLPRLDVAYDMWEEHMARAWRRAEDWTGDEQIFDFLTSAGFDGADEDLVVDLWEPIGRPLVEKPPRIHDGAIEVLRSLKAEGKKLAIISNTGHTWGTFLRRVHDRLGFGDLFDHRTFSDEEQVRKPASAIFERTLAALRLRPEEVAHVGDDVDADVKGARSARMHAIWYDTGFWKGATAPEAAAVLHRWGDLPDALQRCER